MKKQEIQLAVLAVLLVAALAAQAKVLPEFMNAQQLTAWRAQHTVPAVLATQSADDQTLFFTGKPYESASKTYVFMFRSYSPVLARWTSVDPSGFPNGANNQLYVSAPTRQLDALGLFYPDGTPYVFLRLSGLPNIGGSWLDDELLWSGSKTLPSALILEALNHADGTTPGPWTLSSGEAALIQGSGLYQNTIYQDVLSILENHNPSDGSYSITAKNYVFGSTDWEQYVALHSLGFSFSGQVTTETIGKDTEHIYNATVSLSKDWSFSRHNTWYEAPWNAAGYRLQTHGYLRSFPVSGTFTDEWVWNTSE